MPVGYIHGTDSGEQARLARLNRLTNPAFLDFLALRSGERGLEVGSGLGILAGEVAALVAPTKFVGIELSAAQLAAVQPSAADFCRGDARRLPFANGSFDFAYARYLLEHVADPVGVLGEMRRLLRPRGRIALQENDNCAVKFDPGCPRFARVWRRFAALQRRLGGDPVIGKKLFRLLRQAGFQRVELSLQPELHAADMSSFRPWVENFRDLVRFAAPALARQRLASGSDVATACQELDSFAARSDATLIFYWNRARGWR